MALLGLTTVGTGGIGIRQSLWDNGSAAGITKRTPLIFYVPYALFGLTILLMLTAWLCMPWFLQLMNISNELYDDSYHYVMIIAYGLLAMMFYNLLSLWPAGLWETAARHCTFSSFPHY